MCVCIMYESVCECVYDSACAYACGTVIPILYRGEHQKLYTLVAPTRTLETLKSNGNKPDLK